MVTRQLGNPCMLALTQFFLDLALLRRGPQDLPSSSVLLILVAVLSVVIGTVNSAQLFGGLGAALGANLLDLTLGMALLAGLLRFRGRVARWLQTTSAILGLGVLAGGLMLVARASATMLGIADVAVLVEVVLAIWLHVALGSVLRHALEVPLLLGVIIVFCYTVLAFNLIAGIFPPEMVR